MNAAVTIVPRGGMRMPPHDGQPRAMAIDQARTALAGATVWHVNSTATGGGIAELLQAGIGWHERAGLPARWMVVSGPGEYFALTKRIHEMLHGHGPDGEHLGDADRSLYQDTAAAQARGALEVIRPGDVVVLHDPQPLGMAPILGASGARVIWRSHIGTRRHNAQVAEAWRFLRPFLAGCRKLVFSAQGYVPGFVPSGRAAVVHPSIDPASEKCAELDDMVIAQRLTHIGLEQPVPFRPSRSPDALAPPGGPALARVIQDRALPPGAEVILQVARWDRLKDVPGVLAAYARHIAPMSPAELVLAGPDPDDIADDPVGRRIFGEVVRMREELAPAVRARTHLVILSLRDAMANARIVNALQRRASVITQKSLEEGFGLAVTEAMWKRRGVVASAVGGITEQVTDGVHGLLVDPADLPGFGAAVRTLLTDPSLRSGLAQAAHARVAERFLAARELADYAKLYREAVS